MALDTCCTSTAPSCLYDALVRPLMQALKAIQSTILLSSLWLLGLTLFICMLSPFLVIFWTFSGSFLVTLFKIVISATTLWQETLQQRKCCALSFLCTWQLEKMVLREYILFVHFILHLACSSYAIN